MKTKQQKTFDPAQESAPAAGTGQIREADPNQPEERPDIPPTFASRLGEMVWLLSQSPAHRHFSIGDLEWLLMPPLLLGQYKIYYEQGRPIALALWAFLNQEDEQRLLSGVNRLKPEAWCAGQHQKLFAANAAKSDAPATVDREMSDAQLWLVDLIAPGATAKNRLREKALADLIATSFKERCFKFHATDPVTGVKNVREIGCS